MSEPYLILHKVRGEPAFDIAIQLQIGDEEGWIIPTSGHRTYPTWYMSVKNLWVESLYSISSVMGLNPIPSDWPDHYATMTIEVPSDIESEASDLLTSLGLRKAAKPILRRL